MALIFDKHNSVTAGTLYTSDAQFYSFSLYPDDSSWATSPATDTVVLKWSSSGIVWVPAEPEAVSEHALVNQLLDLFTK